MAPRSKASAASNSIALPSQTLIIDNGAYTLKAGFSTSSEPYTIPNCIARDRERKIYVGSDLARCKDFSEINFRRPVEKGYIVNWEAQKEIWEHEFFEEKSKLRCEPGDTGLLLTEAPNALPQLQTHCDQIVFEEFGFASYLRCQGPLLNAYNDIQHTIFKALPRYQEQDITQQAETVAELNSSALPLPAEIMLLIDSGYSHTTITPLLQGRPLQSGIRRLDIGGKLMTNYLTRLLSLRQYDMRNDVYLVNEIKEATIFVSEDFKADMEYTWKGPKGDRRPGYTTSNGIAKDYILPDYHNRLTGSVRDHDPTATKALQTEAVEDVLTLRNERFTVPELLFNPSDIGMRQSGIPQLVMQSLSSLPHGLWPGFLANICVVGGNAEIEGFILRLQIEIRALAPAECFVRVGRPEHPMLSTWKGAAALAGDTVLLGKMSVSKQEYEEFGSAWVQRRFSGLQ